MICLPYQYKVSEKLQLVLKGLESEDYDLVADISGTFELKPVLEHWAGSF